MIIYRDDVEKCKYGMIANAIIMVLIIIFKIQCGSKMRTIQKSQVNQVVVKGDTQT